MNNIFNFATSELSQDAVIAWILNWINEDTSSSLYSLAVKLLESMGVHKDELKSGIRIEQQYKHIDILIVINEADKAIIVEDKVYTGEHDDQIAKYVEEIKKLSSEDKAWLGISDNVDVSTVYLKTGYMYDYDKQVVTDVKINGQQFYEILDGYRGKSEILDSYIIFLKNRIDWYKQHSNFTNISDLSKYAITQYSLMRTIFPEDMWDGRSNLYKVYDGTNNGGTPWTEMVIYEGKFLKDEPYYVFWRIDSDKNGPYISLRFYDKYNKKDEYEKRSHLEEYYRLSGIVKDCINYGDYSFANEEVIPGFRGNYYEAEIFCWHIESILKNWDDRDNRLISDIHSFSKEFIRKAEK